jgi:sec-independent protein translocase protein TatB
MLPDVGGLEWLVIAVVALVVVGPKDLPVMLRRLGQFVARLRAMANEFRSSFDEMARQSELDDLRKEVEALRRGQFVDMAGHEAAMRSAVGDIEQSMADVGAQLSQPFEPSPPPPPLEIAEAPAKPARKPRATKAAAPKAAALENEAAPIVEGGPKPRKPRASKAVEAKP